MKLNNSSASSVTGFSECPAKWITGKDEDRRVNSRNDRSDVGNLVHGALERWRDPESTYSREFSGLELAFDDAAKEYIFAEPLEAYRRGKELLDSAYRLTQTHPTIPIQLMEVIAVEQHLVDLEEKDWQMPGWPIPFRGMIDEVGMIPQPGGTDKEIILIIIDHKTGRPKTHAELTQNDIQPAAYMLYARDVLVPMLEGYGYTVTRIVASWTYIAEGTAVAMYEVDFDHDVTREYIANIMAQQLALVEKFNAQGEMSDEQVNEFLAPYEKSNPYCAYCPRKGVCQNFQRLLTFNSRVDIVGPNVDWNAIALEYRNYQAIIKNAESRLDEIKSVIPVYLDQERLESIPLEDQTEIVANQESRKKYKVEEVRKILGDDFILLNAQVTDTSIKRELDLIARTDGNKARDLETALGAAFIAVPGPRPIRFRKIPITKKGK